MGLGRGIRMIIPFVSTFCSITIVDGRRGMITIMQRGGFLFSCAYYVLVHMEILNRGRWKCKANKKGFIHFTTFL